MKWKKFNLYHYIVVTNKFVVLYRGSKTGGRKSMKQWDPIKKQWFYYLMSSMEFDMMKKRMKRISPEMAQWYKNLL